MMMMMMSMRALKISPSVCAYGAEELEVASKQGLSFSAQSRSFKPEGTSTTINNNSSSSSSLLFLLLVLLMMMMMMRISPPRAVISVSCRPPTVPLPIAVLPMKAPSPLLTMTF